MDIVKKIYRAYKNKITNKLFGVVRLPATHKKKGNALFCYLTEPFTLTPWEHFSNYHTMYWECYKIASILSEEGYDVDIISATNKSFIPKKKYDICVDTTDNLERLLPYLPKTCIKIFHILISESRAYNAAEEKRLANLEQRKGVRLPPHRRVSPSQSALLADYLEGFGNKKVFESFKDFHKPITFIPISSVLTFDFPEHKDFAKARTHFLWFGGGGAVLKGLDLCLEAFAKTPDLYLHICGPVHNEKEFVEVYKKELQQTPNIHTYGRIDIASEQFKQLLDTCAFVIYPSGGEGSSGAIVQVMHGGLIPLITHETGIQEDAGYIPLLDPTPDTIIQTIREYSQKDPVWIKNKSHQIWEYTQKTYTRGRFSSAYKKFINKVLQA